MASQSPNYVLFRGSSHWLRRASNSTSTDPLAGAITLSVTLDPEAAGAITNGTIVGKLRSDNNQRGWKIEYLIATQTVRCTIYGAGDGSILESRETAATVTYRTNVTFTYSTTNGLHAYVNGAASDGTHVTTGTITTPVASTEPLAIAADSTSGTAANIWKGAVYMVAVIQAEATSGDVSGMAADGLLNTALAAHGNLTAYWRHSDITTNAANVFSAWVDNKSSLGLTAVGTVLGQQTSGTAILTYDLWDANLNNLAYGSQGLSSTYTLSAPYRLWGAGLNEPQISSGFRSYRGDFTVVIRARRVAGRTTSNIFRRRGIFLQYVLASEELYIIVGDDNVGSTNKRISWGFKLFPVEGVDAVYVIRYNAVEKDADLFLNQIKYPQVTNVSTASNELTTGMYVGESTDWQNCAITPACLSDAQVDTFVLGLATNAYPLTFPTNKYSDTFTATPSAEADPAALGAAAADAAPALAYADVIEPTWTGGSYANSATTPLASPGSLLFETQVDDRIYTDPNVVIDTVDFTAGVVTVTGHAGPMEGEAGRVWAEIDVISGQFRGASYPQYPVVFKNGRIAISATFQVQPGIDPTGLNVRLVVQPQLNARRIYYSAPVAIAGTLPTDPMPTVVSAPIAADATITATANAGPTNAGSITAWWEEETAVGSGTYQRVSGFDTGLDFSSNTNHAMTFSVGSRTGHTGRKLRFVMQVEANPATLFTSAGYTLTDYSYVAPNPSVQSVSNTPARVVTATGRAGPTDVGLCSTWWELEITTGTFIAVIDKRTGVDLSAQTDITDTFTVPPNFTLTGKKLRFCVQPDVDPGAVYRSTDYTMTDAALTDPTPTMTVATCSLTKLLTLAATLGTSNAGPATVWWEVEMDPGEWTSILDTTASVSLTAGQTRNLSYQLPSRLDLTGKSVRLAVQSSIVPTQIWYSPNLTVTQTAVVVPSLSVSSASEDDLGGFAAAGSIGATNLGTVTVSFQVDVQGDFKTIFEQQSVATSAVSSTPVSANVSLAAGFDVTGKSVRLVVTSATFPELTYTSAAFTVTSSGSTPPVPTVTTATLSAAGLLTLSASITASSLASATVWFEVDGIGGGAFDGRFGKQSGVDLTSPAVFSTSVALPGRLDLTGKTVKLRIQPDARPDLIYESVAQAITVTSFVNPSPAVSAATVSTSNVLSATGAAGTSDIGSYHYWFEVEISPNKFVAVFDKQAGASMASSRQTLTGSVTLPNRFDLSGKSVRLAIQQDSRLDNVYYSSTFGITTPTITPPSMTVTAAGVSISSVFTAAVTLGANNLGSVKTWWEVEITPNKFTALLDTVSSFALPAIGAVVNGSATLPDRFDLTGKSVRFAVQWLQQPENIYYSSLHAITVENLTDPAPLIQSFSVDVWGECTGTVRAGPTNAAFCKVWWEIGIDVAGEFVALFDTVTNVNLFTQQFINANFTLPRGAFGTDYDYTNQLVRFAVQPNNRQEMVFKSTPLSVAPAARIDPLPVLDSAGVSGATVTALAHFGPSNLGDCVWWIEGYLGDASDLVDAVTAEQPAVAVASQQNVSLSFDVATTITKLRIAVSPVRDRLTVYRSAWLDVSISVGQEYTGARVRNMSNQALTIEWLYELTGSLASILLPPQATYYIPLRMPNGSPPESLVSRTWTLARQGKIAVYWNGQWWSGADLPPFAHPG